MKKNCGLFSCLMVALVMGSMVVRADEGEATPKHNTKDVMEKAHKAGLLKKVVAGEASQEEKLALLDLYVSLAENKPAKGTPESWNEKTKAIVIAAAKVAVGRSDGSDLLKQATNCAACHGDHK